MMNGAWCTQNLREVFGVGFRKLLDGVGKNSLLEPVILLGVG